MKVKSIVYEFMKTKKAMNISVLRASEYSISWQINVFRTVLLISQARRKHSSHFIIHARQV